MTISIYNYRKCLVMIALCCNFFLAKAQDSNPIIKRKSADSSGSKMNMDAIYNRPFLTLQKLPIAIGGYLEANSEYQSTDGVSEGLNFQMRRMTLFFASTIAQKIKFMSEIEFEEGTKEISIETALMDIEFHPLLNFRGGILLNPIGAFNQNHDGPRWDFIDRPISATELIPSTLSSVGFGFHGKYFYHNWSAGYEAYLTNGFDDKLILNEDNRTSFHEAKENIDKFNTSNSGLPMFTGKLAIRNRKLGEIGLSFLSGVYNQYKKEGLVVDQKRSASIVAFDYSTSLFQNRISIVGELAKSFVELPAMYVQTYGTQQLGTYCDVVATVWQHKMMGWQNAKLNLGCRFDYVDFNQNKFRNSNEKIYEETWAFTPSIAFRPTGSTVLRLNYKFLRTKDLVGNAPAKTGIIQFGIASYF